ncbi:putative bifunctional diguanylate cyclase/phosphodiesterase [Actinoplanes solisilvae]|uniref:putative bifunctional diguanylate cyclase/phosphodiesterase n=1 Tax=Actinoplanes solisilvae TaxID=2486853 RepID=UPI000FDC7EA9|nr:EAL domain-containing protein [Actinoplanes solisilvae]
MRRSLVYGAGALTVSCAGVAWSCTWHVTGGSGAIVVGNAGGLAGMVAAVLSLRDLGATVTLPGPVRAFWHRLSQSALCLVIGSAAQLILGDVNAGLSLAFALPMIMGAVLALAAFGRLRPPPCTWPGWTRALLDVVTVMVAGAIVFGYVAAKFVPSGTTTPGAAAGGAVGVSSLLILLLIGRAPIHGTGLRLLGVAPPGIAAAAVVMIATSDETRMWMTMLGTPLLALSFCAAACRQHLAAGPPGPAPARSEPRASRGVLPMLAVAVAVGMVSIVSARDLHGVERLVIVGAALIAALVALRQLLGLRENRQLLDGLRAQGAELERIAMTDPLTGLPNRTRFSAVLAERLAAHRPVTVLLIDLDDFKTINDTMGPACGDQLLFEVGQRLRTTAGSDGLPARLGGDEFALLLDVEEVASAEQAAAGALHDLAEPFRVGEHHLLAHASLGVAIAGSGDTADEVLRNADIAMYAAKEGGKAAWTRFEPCMRQEVVNHARLGSELRDALVRGELYLLYQLVFDIVTGRAHGAEALVRWNHPVRGFVSPGEFIPVAERSGLIVPLGSWVLREACEQLARWHREYGDGAIEAINVNVAVRQLREPGFVDEVAGVLAATGLLPRNLVLEVTESSVADGRQVRDTLHMLHELGVRLALDDFGTGQSSLSLLRAFPVDVLKLDKSFVDGIADGEDRGRLAVAAAVAQLAEYLQLSAVAEGIETEAQLIRLRDMGYRLGQGFHMAKPLPAEEAGALMSNAPADPLLLRP